MTYTIQKLNIGVVGLGRMGQRHALNVLRQVPRARLFAVCSPAPHEIVWAKENLEPEGVKVFATFEEMIRTPGLEAVVLASPNEVHFSQTLAAMELGIHVLCEKPVTKETAQLYQLMQKAELSPQTKVMVGFVRRFDENYQDALMKIKNGAIGEPIVVRSHGAEKLDKTGYFIGYARSSGGIFLDTVVHDIDLTLSILGDDIKPKALWATGMITHHHEMKEFDDVDNAMGVVEFWGGRIAQFYHSRTTSHGYDNCTEVFGMAGKISINSVPHNNRVQVSSASGILQDATPSWIDRYREAFVTELNQFTNAILDQTEMPMKLSAALTGLKIATALRKSLRTGEKIVFDENGDEIIPGTQ